MSHQPPLPPPLSSHALGQSATQSLPNVGERIQWFRKKQGLTLEALAQKSGVSKSMLSQIERDLSNPTIAVLWKLACALNVTIHDLIQSTIEANIEKMTTAQTPTMQATEAGYQLRVLNPMRLTASVEWYELILQPSGELCSQAHDVGTIEHLTVLQGTLIVTVAEQAQRLMTGETLRYPADQNHSIRNLTKQIARACLVVEYARA